MTLIENLMKCLPAGDAMTDVGSIFGEMKETYQVIAKLDEEKKAKGSVSEVQLLTRKRNDSNW